MRFVVVVGFEIFDIPLFTMEILSVLQTGVFNIVENIKNFML